jgi:hypothetical protein
MLAASSAAGLEVIFRRSPATGAAWWFSSAFFGTAHWSADGEKCYKYPEKQADKNCFQNAGRKFAEHKYAKVDYGAMFGDDGTGLAFYAM